MIHFHFDLQFVEFLANHREIWLTRFFLLASGLGSANFYCVVLIFLYVAWNKRLAIRLSVLVLFTMSLNAVLKILFKNPRPFVSDGTYHEKWAVSPAQAQTLAVEYSTPSAHAMGSAAFYSYLMAVNKSRVERILLAIVIFCVGASRPYLGVHYGEDVVIGWVIGMLMALAATLYAGRAARLWAKLPYALQIGIAVLASAGIWWLTVALNGGRIDGQVQDQVAYWGFLTGIAIACPLEMRLVNFDPRSGSMTAKLLRFTLSIVLMASVLVPLKFAFAPLAAPSTTTGCALDYICYVAAEVTAIFLAPLIFCRLGLAAETQQRIHLAEAATPD
jgi:membrane-associated phospholipid phosphatase